MKYFDTLPKLIKTEKNGTSSVMTNLLVRASTVQDTLANPLIFYKYDIQEGDTPEIVAHKYYNDSYRYWIVLYANQMFDPQWDWPLFGQTLVNYIEDKYTANNMYDLHHYEKIDTQLDSGTGTLSTVTTIIGEDDYNNVVVGTKTVSLPTGSVTITTEKRMVSNYDYEVDVNDAKRTIKLLNVNYVNQFEKEFKKLMS